MLNTYRLTSGKNETAFLQNALQKSIFKKGLSKVTTLIFVLLLFCFKSYNKRISLQSLLKFSIHTDINTQVKIEICVLILRELHLFESHDHSHQHLAHSFYRKNKESSAARLPLLLFLLLDLPFMQGKQLVDQNKIKGSYANSNEYWVSKKAVIILSAYRRIDAMSATQHVYYSVGMHGGECNGFLRLVYSRFRCTMFSMCIRSVVRCHDLG